VARLDGAEMRQAGKVEEGIVHGELPQAE
jgi:hypothetical protein